VAVCLMERGKGVARFIKVRGLKNSEWRYVQFLCAEYALFGGLGACPQKNLKISCLRLNLLAILAKSLLEMYCFNE